MGLFDDVAALLPEDWLGGLIVTAVPTLLVLAVRFLRRERRKHIGLEGRISTTTVVESLAANPRLALTYDGTQVPKLNVTILLLWNSGRNEIRSKNIASGDPVRLALGQAAEILETKILYQSQSAIASQVAVEVDGIRIEFDYLNPYDAILVHCIHARDVEHPKLAGSLVGPSVSLSSKWEQRAGIHGADDGQDHVVNVQRLLVVSAVSNSLIAGGLFAAFLFTNWWPVLIVAGLLFLLSLAAVWPSADVPRQVQRNLKSYLKNQAASEDKP